MANGASQSELTKWAAEFFNGVPSSGSVRLASEATKYYGGEERIAHGSGNALVIAFPGSSSFTSGNSYKPEMSVLAALLGGQSTIKWSPGFSTLAKAVAAFPGAQASTTHFAYSDAGLLAIQLSGTAEAIRGAAKEAVQALKTISQGTISKEDFTKAVALAKYRALEEGQNFESGLVASGAGLVHGGSAFQIDEIGKSMQSVTVEKLKSVCCPNLLLRPMLNPYLGCEVDTRWQGNNISSRRFICTPLWRGSGTQGIDMELGKKTCLYQQV